MDFQTILFLSAILNVIMLICFFVLCSNVSKIKKDLVPNDNFGALFILYCSVGEKEKAKKLLLKQITMDKMFDTAFYSDYNRVDAQKFIVDKYSGYLKMVDLTIDFDVVDNYLKKIL